MSNQTIEKSVNQLIDFASTSTTNRLKPFEDYLSKSWTYESAAPTFQDSYSSSTELNIHEKLIGDNPFTEIESSIINTVGMDIDDDLLNNQFGKKLYKIINKYDALAIMVISSLLDSHRIKFLQAIQLLSYIGKLRHLPTYYHRTWLLVKNLDATSKYVRDGASLGLLYLENPSTINALKAAMEREPSKQLCANMNQVRLSLERKFNATSIA